MEDKKITYAIDLLKNINDALNKLSRYNPIILSGDSAGAFRVSFFLDTEEINESGNAGEQAQGVESNLLHPEIEVATPFSAARKDTGIFARLRELLPHWGQTSGDGICEDAVCRASTSDAGSPITSGAMPTVDLSAKPLFQLNNRPEQESTAKTAGEDAENFPFFGSFAAGAGHLANPEVSVNSAKQSFTKVAPERPGRDVEDPAFSAAPGKITTHFPATGTASVGNQAIPTALEKLLPSLQLSSGEGISGDTAYPGLTSGSTNAAANHSAVFPYLASGQTAARPPVTALSVGDMGGDDTSYGNFLSPLLPSSGNGGSGEAPRPFSVAGAAAISGLPSGQAAEPSKKKIIPHSNRMPIPGTMPASGATAGLSALMENLSGQGSAGEVPYITQGGESGISAGAPDDEKKQQAMMNLLQHIRSAAGKIPNGSPGEPSIETIMKMIADIEDNQTEGAANGTPYATNPFPYGIGSNSEIDGSFQEIPKEADRNIESAITAIDNDSGAAENINIAIDGNLAGMEKHFNHDTDDPETDGDFTDEIAKSLKTVLQKAIDEVGQEV